MRGYILKTDIKVEGGVYTHLRKAIVYEYYIFVNFCRVCGRTKKKSKGRKIRGCKRCLMNAREGNFYKKYKKRIEVTTYCSKRCQRAHWKEHREFCNEIVRA